MNCLHFKRVNYFRTQMKCCSYIYVRYNKFVLFSFAGWHKWILSGQPWGLDIVCSKHIVHISYHGKYSISIEYPRRALVLPITLFSLNTALAWNSIKSHALPWLMIGRFDSIGLMSTPTSNWTQLIFNFILLSVFIWATRTKRSNKAYVFSHRVCSCYWLTMQL